MVYPYRLVVVSNSEAEWWGQLVARNSPVGVVKEIDFVSDLVVE